MPSSRVGQRHRRMCQGREEQTLDFPGCIHVLKGTRSSSRSAPCVSDPEAVNVLPAPCAARAGSSWSSSRGSIPGNAEPPLCCPRPLSTRELGRRTSTYWDKLPKEVQREGIWDKILPGGSSAPLLLSSAHSPFTALLLELLV